MIPKNALVAAVLAATLMVAPITAQAALSSGAVTLGFGARYQAPDGCSRTHRGVDLSMDAGERVESPIAGTVHFAGRVPASSGGSVLAVSIDSDEGRVTLLPLEQLSVEEGAVVDVGSPVGTLAAKGDSSSEGAHLHVSLRSGELYLDPTCLLSAPQCAPVPEGEPELALTQEAGAKPAVSSPSVMGQGVTLAGSSPVPATVGAGAAHSAGVTAGSSNSAPSAVGESLPMGEGVALAPSVTTPTGARVPGASPATPAQIDPLAAVKSASAGVVRTAAQRAPAIGAPAYLGLLIAVAGGALILSLRAFERRIISREPVSDRLGRTLQQLRTGDTLRGLTSCSGETAFTVPGPSSPGEVTK